MPLSKNSTTKNTSLKVFLLGRDNVAWSIDSDRRNTEKIFRAAPGFAITRNIFTADILYVVWYNALERPWYFYPFILLKKLRHTKAIAVITNEIADTNKIKSLATLIDTWVAPNTPTQRLLQQQGYRTILFPFPIDTSVFSKSTQSREQLAAALGIDYDLIRDKFLIGSFQRDSIGTDLSQPKWQKDPNLLIAILRKIPPQTFLLLLAGPRRHYIVNQCKKYGIPYLFIGNTAPIAQNRDDLMENNLPLERINLLYNIIDLYLVTSRSEGGPKAVLEAAATETLIFSTDVGLAKDILHEDLIFSRDDTTTVVRSITALCDGTLSPDAYTHYNKERYTALSSRERFIENIRKNYLNTQP